MKTVDVAIEKYSKKGHGLGVFEREDGVHCPIEVPFTIPGDLVQAERFPKKSGIYKSRLKEILKPSSDRIEPRCKHFGICGGCRWQQISYVHQLKNKEEFILNCFDELITKDVQILPIIPSDAYWQYRNKMEFTFSQDRSKEKYLGLNMNDGKGKVVNLTECHLTHPWFIETLKAAREWWKENEVEAYNPWKNTGSLQTLTVREGITTGDRLVNLTVSGNPDFALKKSALKSFVTFMRDAIEPKDTSQKLALFLTIKQAIKGQPTRFFEMHLYGSDHIREVLQVKTAPYSDPAPLSFKVSSLAFFQPNTKQAEKLYSAMLCLANIPENAIIYDLYCGTGTLGICAAKRAKQVVGIELSKESSLDARENVKANGLDNVSILTGSVHEKLAEIRENSLFPPPDVVLVDPPRAGLESNALKQIAELSPPLIIYISCNPSTQAENIRELKNHGYNLVTVQPVDQFPHTIHIENIAILRKSCVP